MKRALTLAAVTVAGIGLYLAWAAVATWCQRFFGFAAGGGNGSHYLFWSGSGSDIAELVLIGGLAHVYYRFTCHEPGCWWPGHLMADRHTRSCWHHNPDGRPRRGHVQRRHDQHMAAQAAAAPDSRLNQLTEQIGDLADAIRTTQVTGKRM